MTWEEAALLSKTSKIFSCVTQTSLLVIDWLIWTIRAAVWEEHNWPMAALTWLIKTKTPLQTDLSVWLLKSNVSFGRVMQFEALHFKSWMQMSNFPFVTIFTKLKPFLFALNMLYNNVWNEAVERCCPWHVEPCCPLIMNLVLRSAE